MKTFFAYTAREDAKRLRKTGMSYQDIGNELGCSDSLARKLCLFQIPSYTKSKKNYHTIKKFITCRK